MGSETETKSITKMPDEDFELFMQEFETKQFDLHQLGKLYVILNRKLSLSKKQA